MNGLLDRPGNWRGEFLLAEWWVRPQLNRIVRADDEVHLEPRVMELLIYLAGRHGQVVSKEEIVQAVWEGQFITDSALTRAMADLRKALGDDVRNPRFIATISKRGYRLIAPLRRQVAARPESISEAAAVSRLRGLAPGDVFALTWRNRTLPLGEGEHFLGRAPEGVVCISSRKVSRRHARILVTPEGATLEDLGSKNGTYLNGRRMEEAEELTHGDEISIGPATLVFKAFVPDGSTETELFSGRRSRSTRVGDP